MSSCPEKPVFQVDLRNTFLFCCKYYHRREMLHYYLKLSFHLRVPPNVCPEPAEVLMWVQVMAILGWDKWRLKRAGTSLKLEFPSTSHVHLPNVFLALALAFLSWLKADWIKKKNPTESNTFLQVLLSDRLVSKPSSAVDCINNGAGTRGVMETHRKEGFDRTLWQQPTSVPT